MCLALDCVDPHDIIFHNNMPAAATERLYRQHRLGFWFFPGTTSPSTVSHCDNNFIRASGVEKKVDRLAKTNLKLMVYDNRYGGL